MRHLWSQVWIALRWFWSFKKAVAGSLSELRIAVSSAKVAVVVAGEVKMSVKSSLVFARLRSSLGYSI
jgi:hypothetical protein